ncbi:MAG: lysophospholipid acyltransferase family protein [Desulfovibrio sp.]|jgi:putative hemolysin|nr:lysophospholipid acyltransferase family protein [Desulfovibrio sp.]
MDIAALDAASSVAPPEQGANFPVSPFLFAVPKLKPLLETYRRLPPSVDPAEFARRALDALAIRVRPLGEHLELLPASGPLLLTANHPFGAVEGLALAALFPRIRADFKILVNHVLCGIPELRRLFIPVEVFSGKDGCAVNLPGVRAAVRHIEGGGALAIFPAGVVSHWHARNHRVTDPQWKQFAGRLARVPGAQVVPLFFEGRNSLFFQAAGCIHPILRTMLLPREMWRARGREVRVFVGKPVDAGVLSALCDDEARIAYIRACCYALRQKGAAAAGNRSVPVAAPCSHGELWDEVETAREHILAEEGNFQVFTAQGDTAPHILHEIGRLREETFRAEHEGSGKAADIDRFDPHYTHLVLWDNDAGIVAGSYRIRVFLPGGTQKAAKKLYTATLFRFKPEFFERCGICMELGRAFVARKYQRDYAPLMMLWKGIARFAVMRGVRTLFGACSIGLGYTPASIFMLRRYLEEHHYAPDLAGFVRGRSSPAPFPGPNEPHVRGLDYRLLNRAVNGLEAGKNLPVLFRHYLQLGGRVAAFHEDKAFGTQDALMVVSLATIPKKTMTRYLGRECLLQAQNTPGAAAACFII